MLKVAMEGRLVPTEASLARAERHAYEPAEVLLTRILKERRRRWEEREFAKLKAAGKTPKDDKWKARYKEPAAPHTSKLAELPEGWCWASLLAVTVRIVDGTHHTPRYEDDGIAFISVKDIRNGRIDFTESKHISPSQHEELSARCKPERGDLLITKSGTIGRTAVVRTDRPFSLFVSVALLKLVDSGASAEWIELAIQSWLSGISIDNDIKGSTIKNLHLEDLRVLPVPLPPLAEQSRIIEEVQRLFSVSDRAMAQVNVDVRRCMRLRQAVFRWAFAGKLVEQNPNDEPRRHYSPASEPNASLVAHQRRPPAVRQEELRERPE